jgi:competence protein ComGC
MIKTLKFLIAPLLVIALTAGSASAVLAQPAAKGPERRTALITRVAEILNIDQQKLEDAFKQAQQEQGTEALNQRLSELVTAGTITQQQADQFKTWIDARPDVPAVGPQQLKKLIEEGKITQQQADALKAWQESKPDIPKIRPGLGERLVEEGVLTQGQADEYQSWSQSRPDLPKVGPKNMKKLLNEGMINREQANTYKTWMQARPEEGQGLRPKIRQVRTENTKERNDALMTRVATILGIDKQKLVDAFEQAQNEMRGQALDTKLQELIGQGILTQQQADAYKAWMQSRPNVPKLPMLP